MIKGDQEYRILATHYTHAKFPNAPSTLFSQKELLWVVNGKVERISGRVIHSIRSGSIWDHLVCGFKFQDLIPLASERAESSVACSALYWVRDNLQHSPLYIASIVTLELGSVGGVQVMVTHLLGEERVG